MFDDEDLFADQGPPKPLWRRIGVPAAAAIAIISSGVIAVELMRGSTPAPRPHEDEHITRVMLPPPPPPPPPPKPPPPTPQKTVEEKPKEQVSPQKASVPKPMKAPPAPPQMVQTSIAGPGAGSLGLGSGGGGDCLGEGCGTGPGGGGDNDGYYSQLLQSQIEAALRRDEKLRYAKYSLRVTFKLDRSGHITNAAIATFTGDEDVRAEVSRVLLTVSTNDSPPADMTAKTFTVRITERSRA
jgi:outer membrane biosynthesis protein TonB